MDTLLRAITEVLVLGVIFVLVYFFMFFLPFYLRYLRRRAALRKEIKYAMSLRITELTQAQQNELAALLSNFKGQRGTLVASPSTPEAERFVEVLSAALRAAGWQVDILPGSPTGQVLWPSGFVARYAADEVKSIDAPDALDNKIPNEVFVWYAADSAKSIDASENVARSRAAAALVDKLREYGTAAALLPGELTPPNTISIVVSARPGSAPVAANGRVDPLSRAPSPAI